MGLNLLRVGDVWWGTVPYGEVVDAKKRPVVILGWRGVGLRDGDAHVLVVPSSTFSGTPAKARESDIGLKDWKVAGLEAGSFIQCARLWSLSPLAIDFDSGLLGSLDAADLNAVMGEIAAFFSVPALATV